MIPQETVDLILDTARVEDVVSDFVTLKRRGASFVACCPFHNEKTPSFYVTPSKGIYHCFGCGKGGSAVGFVMEYEHCSYQEALRYIAKRYNIDIREETETAEEIALRQRRESLLLASEFAKDFFARQLASGEGRSVGYAYFKSRGLEDETIGHFGLGWAPSGKTALIDAAREAGYKMEYLLGAGLAVEREDGSVVDKFHERVMFPIHSVSGRVVAFSGRTLRSDNPAKYVNSAETEIYKKSRNLLGIYFAKAEISRLGKCILVEGNVDMVTMHQLGIRNVVASCGTALTVEQIRLIRKFTENVTIMYDGDSAGIHAALRGINLVLAEGLNVKIVLLPDGEDPDSYCRKHTLQEVTDFISSNERDFIEFKTDLLLSEAGNDPLKKANLINDIADTIADIPDAVKRSVYVEATAGKFGIESSILFERINGTRRKLQEDAARDAERRERAAAREAAQTGGEDYPSDPGEPVPDYGMDGYDVLRSSTWQPENRNMAKAEEDLLYFLLTNGCELLEFESDSDYYSPDAKATVADFIGSALEEDGAEFANSVYRRIYDAYMGRYYEGETQEEIVRHIMNSEDRDMANAAVTLSTRKYELTVGAFEASLTTNSYWLVNFVPKAILYFNCCRVKDRMEAVRVEMTRSPEKIDSLMLEYRKLQEIYRKINKLLGRK